MKRLNLSAEDICTIGRDKGLKEICSYEIVCKDVQQESRRDYNITIVGIDSSLKRKKLMFTITEWEEIVEEDGDN